MHSNITNLEPNWGIDFAKPPQFEIRYIEARDEILYVLGIAHSEIKLADSFRFLAKYPAQTLLDEHDGEILLDLRLRVQSISAYHNRINRINADMNAGIELTGDWSILLDILAAEGWTCLDNACHQWRDNLTDTDKLVLSR